MEIKKDGGTISSDIKEVKLKWKDHFCNLLNQNDNDQPTYRNAGETDPNLTGMADGISILEVRQGLKKMKKNAVGYDELPAEVLHSEQCISFLHLFGVKALLSPFKSRHVKTEGVQRGTEV